MTRFGRATLLKSGLLATAICLTLALNGLAPWQAVLIGINVATMLCYGYDKHLARSGKQRVPEAALHLMAAAGGSPGAFVGQLLFRHKTRDRRFLTIFWSIAALQIAAITAIFWWRQS